MPVGCWCGGRCHFGHRAAADAGLLVRPERLTPRAVLLAPSLLVTADEVECILTAVDAALAACDGSPTTLEAG